MDLNRIAKHRGKTLHAYIRKWLLIYDNTTRVAKKTKSEKMNIKSKMIQMTA